MFGRYIITEITKQWPEPVHHARHLRCCAHSKAHACTDRRDEVEHLRAKCVNNIFREETAPKGVFAYGQRVTLKNGPLAYHLGTYDCAVGKNREAAIFNLFGSDTRVIFKRGELAAA